MSRDRYLIICEECGHLSVDSYYEMDDFRTPDALEWNAEKERKNKKKVCAKCSSEKRYKVGLLDDDNSRKLFSLGYTENQEDNFDLLMKFVATIDLIALKFVHESYWDDTFINKLIHKHGSKLFNYIKHPKNQWLKIAFKIDPKTIKFINNPTRIEIRKALDFNPLLLKYVPKQIREIEIELVKKNGMVLEFCQFQDDEMRMLAVKKNGNALQFICPENQTEKLCLAAVSQRPMGCRETDLSSNHSLEYVHKQTQQIINAALMISEHNRKFIKEVK